MAFVLNDVDLTIGGTSFENQVSSAAFVPSAGTVEFKPLTPGAVETFPITPTWVLNLTYAQDFTTDDTLAMYLYEHEGETIADVIFAPRSGGRTWTADITIVPGQIGGDVDTVAVATVSLGSTKPVPNALP